MNEKQMIKRLFDTIAIDMQGVRNVETFEDAGLLTRDSGLVVTTTDGAVYQLTVTQARAGKPPAGKVDCPDCEGTGADVNFPREECDECDGTGYVNAEEEVSS